VSAWAAEEVDDLEASLALVAEHFVAHHAMLGTTVPAPAGWFVQDFVERL
jgi:hypothetical protein